jgi:uncharacterized protein (TIGR01777 family)
MKIAVTGSTGLVGSAVVERLRGAGHEVVRVVRGKAPAGEEAIRWDPGEGSIDAAAFEGLDAVVHLAGENIASGRWTAARKAAIRDSRVKGTTLLCGALAGCSRPPKTLVCASAIGYYGDRGEETVAEDDPPGTGFLPELCREWEEACAPAARKGIRVVNLRIGVVLAAGGGALGKMLPLFRAGLGGILGTGRQYVSWIALDDLAGIVLHVLEREELRGPVNAVSPCPVTNRELTEALAWHLSRPALLPVPAFALRLALGEMADALLLTGACVACRRLDDSGYRFRHPEIRAALSALLGPRGAKNR